MQGLCWENVIYAFYSDNAPELSAAAEELDWVHPTSTPFLSKRNGKAERRNELMEDGTATALRTAGFPDNMWDIGGAYQSTARNLQIRNGDSCYNKRHQKGHFPGTLAVLGQLVYMVTRTVQEDPAEVQQEYAVYLHGMADATWRYMGEIVQSCTQV